MGKIIQIDTSHGHHPHILHDAHLAQLRHRVVPIAVLQRDKGIETIRFVLQAPQPIEMVDPIRPLLDVTVQDRRIALQSDPMGLAVHGQPRLGRPLLRTNLLPDLFVENLCTASGDPLSAASRKSW